MSIKETVFELLDIKPEEKFGLTDGSVSLISGKINDLGIWKFDKDFKLYRQSRSGRWLPKNVFISELINEKLRIVKLETSYPELNEAEEFIIRFIEYAGCKYVGRCPSTNKVLGFKYTPVEDDACSAWWDVDEVTGERHKPEVISTTDEFKFISFDKPMKIRGEILPEVIDDFENFDELGSRMIHM